MDISVIGILTKTYQILNDQKNGEGGGQKSCKVNQSVRK